MKRFIVALGLLSSTATVSAGPVLLASFNKDASSGGGSGPVVKDQVQFVLQLSQDPPFSVPADPDVGVGAGIFWDSGATGSAVFSRHKGSAVSEFAALASDGNNDWVRIYTHWGGYVFQESEVFGRGSDLIGYDLSEIELVVHSVDVVPLPEVGGSMVYWNVTYNFYGTPIPEPQTGILLWIAGAVVFVTRSSSRFFLCVGLGTVEGIQL